MSKSIGLGLVVGCLFLVRGVGAQEAKKDTPAEAQQVKLFRLQLCDPDEVALVLQHLLGDEPPPARTTAAQFTSAFTPPAETMPRPGAEPAIPVCKVTADARSGSVIVRGRPEQLELAAELISIVEQPPGKPLPKTKRIQPVELKNALVEEVAKVTERLEMPVRVAPLSEMKLVVAAGAEETLQVWSKLARDLDVPERKIDGNNMRRLGILSRPPIIMPPLGPVPAPFAPAPLGPPASPFPPAAIPGNISVPRP